MTHIMKTMPSRLIHIVIVTMVTLAWSNLAVGGEIHDAAKRGDLEKVKALLKENPDLASSKDNTGWTPSHLAAQKGFKDVVEWLLANKAQVNAKDNIGITPLHRAVLQVHRDVAELLRLHGGHE